MLPVLFIIIIFNNYGENRCLLIIHANLIIYF